MADEKQYALRRDNGGMTGSIYLQEGQFLWTGVIAKVGWMTFTTALSQFYKRVLSDYPRVGAVSEPGLVIVHRQFVHETVIKPIIII